MKRLEKNIETKLVPGPAATMCSLHYEEEYIYRCGKFITLRDGAIPSTVRFVLIFHYYIWYHICQEII